MSKIREQSIPALDSVLSPPALSLSELYHENTKLHPLTVQQMVPPNDYSASDLDAMSRAHKQYRNVPRVKLPSVEGLPQNGRTFDEVLSTRRSKRDFADRDLELEELSKILHQSYGITGELPSTQGIKQNVRSAPSAGALYPAEIYLAIRKVAGVEPGIYHYNVPDHALELLIPGDPTEKALKVCCGQEHVLTVTFFVRLIFFSTPKRLILHPGLFLHPQTSCWADLFFENKQNPLHQARKTTIFLVRQAEDPQDYYADLVLTPLAHPVHENILNTYTYLQKLAIYS